MDNFRALPKLSEKINEMVANGQARLATVVAVYLNEVDAQLSDGSVGRFATTHVGLPVGQRGVLIAATGGSKIFTPLGLQVPLSKTGGAYQTVTVSSAGTYPISNAAVNITGLTPGTQRNIVVTTYIRATGSGTPNAFFGMQIVSNGATIFQSVANTTTIPANSVHSAMSSRTVTVGADGTISAIPAVQWVSGTITVTWAVAVILVL